jgi:hypothetical protein
VTLPKPMASGTKAQSRYGNQRSPALVVGSRSGAS